MKKLIAGFAAIAITLSLVGGIVSEAQAQAAFTRDLTIGSSGDDVASLQAVLVESGYLVIPTGVNPGYFGGLTKSAVMKWQAANALPSTGYFGPMSRGKVGGAVVTSPVACPAGMVCTPVNASPSPVACPVGYTCTTTEPTTSPSASSDREGQLASLSTVGDVESSVDEGDSDVNVLGIEFDAKDSNMTIERVDVNFQMTSGTASNQLDDYVDSVSLWLDGKKLASQDVDESTVSSHVYSFRFSGLKGVVNKDDTAQIYVAIDTVSNIDSGDTDGTWTVNFPVNAIRAVDEAGISDTYVASASTYSETFLVAGTDAGALAISQGSNNPEAGIVTVDATNATTDILLAEAKFKAKDSVITVHDLPVGLTVTRASNVGDIVKTLKLMQGDKVLKTKSIPASAGTYEQILFNDIDVEIAKDTTVTFKIVADIKALDSADLFNAGDTLLATTSASGTLWDVEDTSGTSVAPTGTAGGTVQTFYENGIVATFKGAEDNKNTGSIANDADSVDFTIKFSVTATGDDDVYLDGDVVIASTSPTNPAGLAWSTTTDSTTGTSTSPTGILTADNGYRTSDGDVNNSGDKRFKIASGETRDFTFKVTVTAGGDNVSAGVQINALKWDTVSQDDMSNTYNFSLDNFRTDTVTGLFIR